MKHTTDETEQELDLTEEENLDGEYRLKYRPGRWFKFSAVLVLIAFVFFSSPELTYFLTDKFGFLEQNRVLRDDEIVQMCKPAVVSIEAVDASNSIKASIKTGTGFNIDPSGIIITNQHIVSGAGTITIAFDSGEKFYANQFDVLPGYDVAVITLNGSSLPSINLNQKDRPKAGDIVTIIGNPLGFQKIAQRGKVLGYRENTSELVPDMVVELPINPGNSGSPVINAKAQAIGIIYASSSLDSNGQSEPIALAIPAQVLKNLPALAQAQ